MVGGGGGGWVPSKNLVTSDRLVRVSQSRSESVTIPSLGTLHSLDRGRNDDLVKAAANLSEKLVG